MKSDRTVYSVGTYITVLSLLPYICRQDTQAPPHSIQLIIDALAKIAGDWRKPPSDPILTCRRPLATDFPKDFPKLSSES